MPRSSFHNFQVKELLQLPHLSHLHSLNLRGADLSLINFDDLCARFSILKMIDLTAVTFLPDHHLANLTRIRSLRSLAVSDVQSLRPVKDLTHLTSLKVTISTAKFVWEPSIWAGFTNLEVLDLSGSTTSARVGPLEFPSQHLTRVTRLKLNDCTFGDPMLIVRLMSLPNLEKLSMNRSSLVDRNPDEFMERCTALTKLSIKSYRGYLNGLAKLTQLRVLHAIKASVYSDELKSALASMTQLVSLSFSVTWPFTQSDAMSLLTRLTKLRALALGNMSDVDQVLASLGEHLVKLRSIDFSKSRSSQLALITNSLIRFPQLARVIMPQKSFAGDWF